MNPDDALQAALADQASGAPGAAAPVDADLAAALALAAAAGRTPALAPERSTAIRDALAAAALDHYPPPSSRPYWPGALAVLAIVALGLLAGVLVTGRPATTAPLADEAGSPAPAESRSMAVVRRLIPASGPRVPPRAVLVLTMPSGQAASGLNPEGTGTAARPTRPPAAAIRAGAPSPTAELSATPTPVATSSALPEIRTDDPEHPAADTATPTPAGPALAGRVLDAAGAPVPGASVVAFAIQPGASELLQAEADTDADGFYQVWLAPGRYRVRAGAPGFATRYWRNAPDEASAEVVAVGAGWLALEFRLPRLEEQASIAAAGGTATEPAGPSPTPPGPSRPEQP
jgi:hypothetical protein